MAVFREVVLSGLPTGLKQGRRKRDLQVLSVSACQAREIVERKDDDEIHREFCFSSF